MAEIKKLLHFFKPYKRMYLTSMAFLLTVIFLDLMIPRLIQHIVDQGVLAHDLEVVKQTSIWMFALSVTNTLLAIANNYFSVTVGEGIGRDIRAALMEKIQQFSHAELDRFSTGMLITRVTSDINTLQRMIRISLRIGTRAPLILLGSIVMMFMTNARLAAYIVPIYIISLLIIGFVSQRMEPLFNNVKDRLDRLNTVLQENIAGALVVKSFARADTEERRFKNANDEFTQYSVEVSRFVAVMPSGLTLLVNMGMVVVLWLGGYESFSDKITIGQIMAFTNYLFVSLHPLLLATDLANLWANGLASTKRVNEVLDTIPSVGPAEKLIALPNGSIEKVVFEKVSFGYGNEEEGYVLSDIQVEARKGQSIAILGATGSGKTSFINLLPRFYDTSFGRVMIDGVDIRAIDPIELRKRISVVPQESILFTGTVRENIAYGAPNATEEQIIHAAKVASAHDFITKLPKGYEEWVEERGNNFSGGQKQRLSIARALVTDPDILIFDDATSAVDVETELSIQTAMAPMLLNKISFIVAQRVSTVLSADMILVLEHGKLAAVGNHERLLRESPIYREIYDSQLGGKPNGEEVGVADDE